LSYIYEMVRRYSILFTLLIIRVVSFAQTDTIDYSKTNRYFRLIYENDFFSQTDRYYTQGVWGDFIAPIVRYSPVSYLLFRLNKRSQKYYGITFEQDCFTPRSIRYDTLNTTERPYGANMYLSHFLTSIDPVKKRRLTTKIDLGIIGPCARCEDEQKAIHKALNNIRPLGWENQLASGYMINYDASFEQGMLVTKNIELIALLDARAGTIYDDASVGILGRAGFMNSYFKHLGLIKNSVQNKFQLFIFSQAKLKVVGYNGMMQGGLFTRDNIYVLTADKIERAVFMFHYGLTAAYKRFSAEYSKTYITKEFHNGIEHGWGSLKFTICF
jgi:lipid A 3-O-deacylase